MNEYDVTKYEKREMIAKYVSKIDEMTKEAELKFAELQKEAETDSGEIDPTDLVTEQNYSISIMQKWITKMAEEKTTLKKINKRIYEMDAELYDYYKHNWDKSTNITDKAIEKYSKGHPCLLAVTTYAKTVEDIVEYTRSVIEVHKSRQFAIKNIIELKKMELGIT